MQTSNFKIFKIVRHNKSLKWSLKYLSEYSIKHDFLCVFGISWGSQTCRYAMEGKAGYQWEYGELRDPIVWY